MKKAGIICTIGPSSEKPDILKQLAESGMRIARLNFSHGSHEDHLKVINSIRQINEKLETPIRILQDLEGFRIRVGDLDKDGIELKEGEEVNLGRKTRGKPKFIPVDYEGSFEDIDVGSYIYIDDGYIALRVRTISADNVKAVVVTPGRIKRHKGVNIPGLHFAASSMTDKDKTDLEFGLAGGIDMVAQSFVRNRGDIADIRNVVKNSGKRIPVIAKIENSEGFDNIDGILEEADGIMVARGDLGVSLPVYQVAVLQKILIAKCLERKKTAITATQMLESMVKSSRPTRAEVSDIANAILDGTDYVMLSGETAVGAYPIETVSMMQDIIQYTVRAVEEKRIGTCGQNANT